MPAGNNSRALERLLRESKALEAQAGTELASLNETDLNNSLKSAAQLELEAQAALGLGANSPAGTDNALDPAAQPVYKLFDILQWDLWQKGTEPWPMGCVEVSADIKIKVKSKHAPGKHGSRHVNRGKQHTEVEIKCTLWTRVHFAAYTEVAQTYGKNLAIGKTGDAIRIWHPNTLRAGVERIVIVEVGSPKHKGNQLFEATIKAREFTKEDQRARSGPSRAAIALPPSQIDRLGGINRSTAPPVTPASTEGVPASGIPQPIASGL